MQKEKRKIYYFSGTHWDREWYQSFQGFRFRLVEMVNDLIEGLENDPKFKVFHFDGQTIVLEDYLEIEPDQKERLGKLISDGRIKIGPWYVMPDEFLLSGESLIRNMMMGHEICKTWGVTALKYGYICDIFGHIAQMPQIFNGFDIHYALLGRGTNEHTTPAHFLWESPDNSRCITFKLADNNGYGDFLLSPVTKENDESKIDGVLQAYLENEFARSDVPITLLMDATDHAMMTKKTADYLERIQKLYPDAEVHHTDVVHMGEELERFRDILPVKCGELREPAKKKGGFLHLITHTLSSRYPIKKANDVCQTLLEKWVEPFLFIAELSGMKLQKSYVDLAYKNLIQNHPHDSICGCSIDQVHKDMDYRFDQTKMISNQLIEAVMNEERNKQRATDNSNTLALLLFNPLPYERKETVTANIEFPLNYPNFFQEPFGYERKNSFKLYDNNGYEIPYGITEIKKGYYVRKRNQYGEHVDLYTVSFEAQIPAMGISEYKVVPFEASSRYLNVFATENRMAENEFVKLIINENGTISIVDKESKLQYNNLLRYLDDGEIGDGWYHVNPVNDRVVDSEGFPCIISLVENTPAKAVFQIAKTICIPENMEYISQGIKRSEKLIELEITSYVSLSSKANFVEVETEIQNKAKDHRLKLVIPTNIVGDTYFANQPFTFVERKIGIDTTTQEWKECEVPEKQMGGIVGKKDQFGNGLAFVSAYGLHECAAMNDNNNSLHITLFRSFRKTVRTNGEEGGQIIGTHQFKYRLVPLHPDTSYAELIRLQETLQTGIKTATVKESKEFVPKTHSYFEIFGEHICVSMIKRSERCEKNEFVVRIYNMSPNKADATFTFCKELQSVTEVNLNEEYITPVPFHGCSARVSLDGWKIKTYLIKYSV